MYITCIRKNKEYYTIAITNHIYICRYELENQRSRWSSYCSYTIITLTEIVKQSYTCYMQAAH